MAAKRRTLRVPRDSWLQALAVVQMVREQIETREAEGLVLTEEARTWLARTRELTTKFHPDGRRRR